MRIEVMPKVNRIEARSNVRTARRVHVRYMALEGPTEGESVDAMTLNIGVGGAFIETDDPLPVRTHLRLFIGLPHAGTEIEMNCEVRWMADAEEDDCPGMGLRFQGMAKDELDLLHRYLQAHYDA